MYELIMTWWPVVPSIIVVATVIAKITPTQTDDIWVARVTKFVSYFGIHAQPTKKV